MLRALSLAALVLLCSATSLLAQERHIATYGGVSGVSGRNGSGWTDAYSRSTERN